MSSLIFCHAFLTDLFWSLATVFSTVTRKLSQWYYTTIIVVIHSLNTDKFGLFAFTGSRQTKRNAIKNKIKSRSVLGFASTATWLCRSQYLLYFCTGSKGMILLFCHLLPLPISLKLRWRKSYTFWNPLQAAGYYFLKMIVAAFLHSGWSGVRSKPLSWWLYTCLCLLKKIRARFAYVVTCSQMGLSPQTRL